MSLAPNKKIFGISGDGRWPLPFCLIDSHDPKNPVSEVSVNCYIFSSGILIRKSFGSGFHGLIAVSKSSEDYCTFPVLQVEKKSSQVSLQDTDCKECGNEPFCWLVEIGPKSCILCLWKRMTLTWLLLTCLKHREWEPTCTPKLISQAYVSFLEISSVPALHLLSILYFTTSIKIFISSFHRKEFPFGKAMLRVGWLSRVEKRWNT